jgi:DDE superfamily endonuclease
VICLDQMGPESAKSFPGQQLVRTASAPEQPPLAERARQEIDYGRRGKGYIFGALRPVTGEAFTQPYTGRTIADWVEFLERVDAWVPQEAEAVYAILDNLNVHRATDVLLFSLSHPRWEFVFQPIYAAYLNLLEPWWKVLRSLALKGRRLATWEQVCQAIEAATAYWNAHRHPFIWSRRRRHRPRRQAGIAVLPKAA